VKLWQPDNRPNQYLPALAPLPSSWIGLAAAAGRPGNSA
jgi:hypothetical protein